MFFATVDVFDGQTNAWSVVSLSTARSNTAAVVIGEYQALFAGGLVFDKLVKAVPTTEVDLFNAKTGLWSVSALPFPRAMLSAAAMGSKAFFTGDRSPTVDVYDAQTAKWGTFQLSSPRLGCGAVSVGLLVLFAGGDDTGPLSGVDIESYCPSSYYTNTSINGCAGGTCPVRGSYRVNKFCLACPVGTCMSGLGFWVIDLVFRPFLRL